MRLEHQNMLQKSSGWWSHPSEEYSVGMILPNIWKNKIDVGISWNRGTPKSSIFMEFSLINQPFMGTPILGNPHVPKHQSVMSWSRHWTLQRPSAGRPRNAPLAGVGNRDPSPPEAVPWGWYETAPKMRWDAMNFLQTWGVSNPTQKMSLPIYYRRAPRIGIHFRIMPSG